MRTLLLALLLGACAPVEAVDEPIPDRGSGMECSIDELDSFIGREASEALGAEMMKAAGAGAFRWVPKDGMITMDYRPDRLNVYLDGDNRVERVSCG